MWQICAHKPLENGFCSVSLPTAQAPKGKLHSGRTVWPRTQGLTLFQHRFLWNYLQQRKDMQDRSPGVECKVNMWVNWRIEWVSYEVPVHWSLHLTDQQTQQCSDFECSFASKCGNQDAIAQKGGWIYALFLICSWQLSCKLREMWHFPLKAKMKMDFLSEEIY